MVALTEATLSIIPSVRCQTNLLMSLTAHKLSIVLQYVRGQPATPQGFRQPTWAGPDVPASAYLMYAPFSFDFPVLFSFPPLHATAPVSNPGVYTLSGMCP